MRFIELFAGIGGFRLGLERAGHTCVWANEIDPYACKVYRKNWPDGTLHEGDIRTIDPAGLPDYDLLVGGFPCQPVSLAGRRKAQEDARWLWPEIFRIVRATRPERILLENVPGLLSAGLGDVLRDLASVGYDAEWDCVSAAAVGAPHLRYRIFIVAYPQGVGRRERIPESEILGRQTILIGQSPSMGDADRSGLGGQPRRRPWQEPANGHPQLEEGPMGHAMRGRRNGKQGDKRQGSPKRGRAWKASEALAHANGAGCQERCGSEPMEKKQRSIERGGQALAYAQSIRGGAGLCRQGPRQERQSLDRCWWEFEPDVGRVAHGVPSRVDRLKCLGNAVVPQVIEAVAEEYL